MRMVEKVYDLLIAICRIMILLDYWNQNIVSWQIVMLVPIKRMITLRVIHQNICRFHFCK